MKEEINSNSLERVLQYLTLTIDRAARQKINKKIVECMKKKA